MADITVEQPGSVLLIENDPALVAFVSGALASANYAVTTAGTSREAFTSIFKSPPDVILLDINLPDLDGFHMARELKRHMMFRHIPLIVLSNGIDFLDKMRSLDIIMDEYLVKPLDAKDLVLRTKLVQQRAQSQLDANPLTRLPGNIAIVRAIKARVGTGKPYAVGYADLNNFKAFNDKYGFSNGDEVIKFTANLILEAVQKLSPSENFVGHIGGDDFIFICSYEAATDICQFITERFDKHAPNFYADEDRQKGSIMVEDRRGVISQFPFVSVAVGMVSDEGNKFSNLGQINHSLTQLKKYAKSFQGSAFVRDRRTLSSQLAEFTWGPGSTETSSSKVLDQIANALGTFLPGQLADIVRAQNIIALFQPIIDMKTDEVVGHEALIRGPAGSPLEFPDALFQTARGSNQVLELDILCMKKILALSHELHRGMKLFVNIFPETLIEENALTREILNDPRLKQLEVVFELAGSNRASDPADLFHRLSDFKQGGFKVCIDGAVALQEQGIRSLPELKPDYIKLNMMNYTNMVNDYQKQTDFFKTVHMLKQVGSEVICTKLESRSDSYLAVKAGVRLGQGFLFARPSQLPNMVAGK
jgi:diguanylate cyclase (GGDEF)-like protein